MARWAKHTSERVNRLILLGALLLPAALIFMRWGWSLFDMRSFQPPAPILAVYWVALAVYTFVLIRALARGGLTIRVLLAFIWPAIDVLAALGFAPITHVRADGLPSVAVAGFVCWGVWFFHPFAGPAERRRRAFWRYALLEALRHGRYRRRVARRFALPVLLFTAPLIITPLIVWAPIRNLPSPGAPSGSVSFWEIASPMAMLLPMAAFCLLFIAYASADWVVQVSTAHGVAARPCHRCGMDCREAHFDERGWGRCPECGSAVHRGQWIAPPCLSKDATRRRTSAPSLWLPMLAASLLSALLFVTFVGVLFDHALGFIGVSGLLMMMVLISSARPLAVMVARAFDRQHIECRECGYALRGTPIEQGIGTCPECGTAFAIMMLVPDFAEEEQATGSTEDTKKD